MEACDHIPETPAEPANTSNETLAALFHRTSRLMARVHHTKGHPRHAQMRVLALLGERGAMSQRELLEECHVRSASLSELLAKLEHHGLILRERNEEDKRGFIITMTEKGKAEAATLEDARQESADMLFAPLSSGEKQQLADLLIKLLVELEETHPELAGHGHHCGLDRHGRGHHGRGHCAHHGRHGERGAHDRPHSENRDERESKSGHSHRSQGKRGCHDRPPHGEHGQHDAPEHGDGRGRGSRCRHGVHEREEE